MNLLKAGGNLGIIIALIVFSVIIIFHEFGHFLLAKKNGIGVTEFALGMGPTIFGVKRGETTYCLKALPIGGLSIFFLAAAVATTMYGRNWEQVYEGFMR